MKTYGYYPGCSVRSTSKAYERSLLGVFKALGMELKELDDWNCCGATAYFGVDKDMAMAVSGRNLALAERQKVDELVAPCAGCYLTLRKANEYLQGHPGDPINKAMDRVDLHYGGKVKVQHPLELLATDEGVKAVAAAVKRPLKGWKVASYYGCQLVRPYADMDDPYDPQRMDRLMAAAGAEPVPYPYKTRCCGGSLTGTVEDVGQRLVYMLLSEMEKRGANAVATACPLCHFNLDAYQAKVIARFDAGFDQARGRTLRPLPILHFTQILGYALGVEPKQLGFADLMTPPPARLVAAS
jgi:heterodisulfide reductase subunit B